MSVGTFLCLYVRLHYNFYLTVRDWIVVVSGLVFFSYVHAILENAVSVRRSIVFEPCLSTYCAGFASVLGARISVFTKMFKCV